MFDQGSDLHRQMQRFIDYMSQRSSFVGHLAHDTWQPNVDVYETPEAVVVVVELAGVSGESVQLEVHGRSLRLSGSRLPRLHPGERRYSHLEIPYGKFERTVHLPAQVEADAAQAEMRDGMLEIVLPFMPPIRPAIRSGSVQEIS